MKSEWKPAGHYDPSRSFIAEADLRRRNYEQCGPFDLMEVRWRGFFENRR
jgi:hypothetical protein